MLVTDRSPSRGEHLFVQPTRARIQATFVVVLCDTANYMRFGS